MKEIDESFFSIKNASPDKKADDFLEKGEKILWRGIPKKSCYIIQNPKSGVPTFFALIWLFIDLSVFTMVFAFGSIEPGIFLFIIPFFAIHMTPVWIWIGGILKARREVYKKEYIITNKRIFELNGNPKYIVSSIMFDEIEGINYKQGFWDRVFRVADIYVSCENNKIVLFDIPNGLFIYDKLQEIASEEKNEKIKKKLFYTDNVECLHCGSYFEAKLARCPNCGAPKEKIKE